MKLPVHSLRWRLQLWHALISLALIVAVGLLAYRLAAGERFGQIERQLVDFERSFMRHGAFAERKGEDAPPTRDEFRTALASFPARAASIPQFRHLLEKDSTQAYIAYWSSEGEPIYLSNNVPADLTLPKASAEGNFTPTRRRNFQEVVRRHPAGFTVLVGRDIEEDLATLRQFRLLLSLGGGAIFLASLAGGWWLAGRALKPIGAISHTASRIAEGQLDERIAIRDSDSELDQLAHVLNGTFDRLAEAIERQVRFTADASHELRTPLTIILSETQRSLKSEREPAQYREFLEHCRTAALRMRGIVDSLLELARHDTGKPGETTHCDLAELARQTASRMAPLAADRGSEIHLELTPTPVSAPAELIDSLLQNLVSNALSHPPEGTPVTLCTRPEGESAVLEIHDAGPGIPPEHLPHLFERFYRADPARSQQSSHNGLGLAIVRSIASSIDGRMEAESSAAHGTTFRLTLPLAMSGHHEADDRSEASPR
ncbi:ATP-binding protein [Haloferula chungangensis]|uniref:histidine kinase n=1 Tax=Haloferula chungangensis TaxID=1048331 RepID=A0ABW2L5Z4_9BACT